MTNLQFYLEEAKGNVDYQGYIFPRRRGESVGILLKLMHSLCQQKKMMQCCCNALTSSVACHDADDSVLFINAGGGAIEGCDSNVKVTGDSFFEGGDVIETNESITEGGDCPSVYHSARYGSFSYNFNGLAPGDYM
jgi:hypothetical protein